MTHYDDCIVQGHISDSEEDIAARAEAVALDRDEYFRVYYAALRAKWGETPDIDAINGLVGSNGVPWWQINGYSSPFNINDLIAAGLT